MKYIRNSGKTYHAWGFLNGEQPMEMRGIFTRPFQPENEGVRGAFGHLPCQNTTALGTLMTWKQHRATCSREKRAGRLL